MKRLIVLCIILFIMLFSPTACNKSDTKINPTISKNIVVGFAQLGDESDWRTANSESIKSAAKEASHNHN